MRSNRSCDQISHDDPAGVTVDDDQIQHLHAGMHPNLPSLDLPRQGRIGAEQKLLACLSATIESPGHLHAAERPVGELPAVFARERHAERDTLIDDLRAYLRQAVYVRFARAEVAAFDRVVE